MTKKELLELGLTEVQVEEIFKIRGKEIEANKKKMDELIESERLAKEELLKATNEVEEIKKNYANPEALEELKTTKESLEAQIAEMTEAHSKEVRDIKFSHALTSKITSMGAKDVNLVRSILNEENIEFDGEEIKGLDEELNSAKETYGYLFKESDKSKPLFIKPSEGGNRLTKDAITEIEDPTERVKAISQNLSLFQNQTE